MLNHLFVQNYALIDELEIDFSDGMTIITGETGAGKSILIGALSLILGQRADTSVLQNKTQKCIVEGSFDVENYGVKDFFETHDLDYEPITAIRREVNSEGRSRAFINDTPVTLAQLKELGEKLVDIHSQHETLSLNNAQYQLSVVDAFALQQKEVESFKKEYLQFSEIEKKLAELKEQENQSKSDLDYFQFQFDELDKADLYENEQQKLEQELEALENAEEIKANLLSTVSALSQGESNLLNQLIEINHQISKISDYFPKLLELEQRLFSAKIELEDVSSELEKLQEQTEFDPQKAEQINDRLNLIYSLQQKHHVQTIEQLLKVKEELSLKLQGISNLDEEIEQLQKELKAQIEKLSIFAQQISANRKTAVPKIEKKVNSVLQQLGMPSAQFLVEQNVSDHFLLTGKDNIRFLFSANKGTQPKETSKVASGGELSRLMLSIKSLVAKLVRQPTIIFDEIDAGVSGEIADKVGIIIRQLAEEMQVISITHLPQIASKGEHHLLVYKETVNGSTKTLLKQLTGAERISEIAKMLSGEKLTNAAVENAKELLKI
ncbi:MAG: DNA repair protein RecN [Flavobacteriales bacterium]|nr:MAG: DNA repair protein RecN [Flavobacteriales bacterium]